MADTYTVLVPDITAASATPNPVIASTALSFSITIVERTVTLEPYYYLSGDLFAGEV